MQHSSNMVLGYSSIAIVTVIFLLQPSELSACSCQEQHPQQRFCDADFVTKSYIKSSWFASQQRLGGLDTNLKFARKTYKIRTKKILKSSESYEILGNATKKQISTPPYDSACGVMHLKNQTNYLLMGTVEDPGRLWFTLCKGMAMEWSSLPVQIKKGVAYRYKRHCDCQTKPCYRPNCAKDNTDADVCTWSPMEDVSSCYKEHSWCRRNSNGQCKWAAPNSMKKCLQKLGNGSNKSKEL